ncbi:MAG: hypothetical protein JW888_12040 [Pirellulales bacterium]|nr:hypothetical protein [Pirellulales bacterium]
MRNVSILRLIGLTAFLALFPAASGCGPSCSEEELGTIVHEVPEVPGSDKEFPLPKLDPSAASEEPTGPPSPLGPTSDDLPPASRSDAMPE